MDPYTLFVLGAFFCLYLWIGNRASKKVITKDDYFLMGRKLGFFPLTMTLFATILGAGSLVGAAEVAYFKGWAVIVYPLGTVIGFLILAFGFGKKLRELNVNTIPEIFEVVYKSLFLRKIAAIFSIVSLYTILIAQGIAIKSFFLTIGMSNPMYFYLIWAVFVGYTVLGGFKAVVDTDIIQGLFVLVGLAIVLFSLDYSQIDAVLGKTQSVSNSEIPWISWLLMPLCFILIGQDMGQRFFATKSSKIIAPATFIAGILLLICSAIAITFGLIASQLAVEVAPGNNVLLIAVQNLTSPLVTNLFVCTIIMAIASTADSILCSISANICSDFSLINRLEQKKQISFSRRITFCIGLSALVFIALLNNVLEVLVFSYELIVSALFVAILVGVLSKNPSRKGAFLAVGNGILGFIIFRLYDGGFPNEVLTLLFSCVGYLMGYYWDQSSLVSQNE